MQGCDHIIKPSCWGIAPSEQEIREKALDKLFQKCKTEELRNKKACDDGVDNITSFQLRARQSAFERVCIWIEELRSKQGEQR